MQTLTVVNRCLATLGEKALASLEEPHPFKGDALSCLSNKNKAIQARGWWFNQETLTLNPMVNGRIALAGDFINVRTYDPNIVERNHYLYDSLNGTDIFTNSVKVQVIRLIPFDALPELAASYISAAAVLAFQVDFDGDSTRFQQLTKEESEARIMVTKDDIRNKQVNMIASNPRLVMLQARNRQIRRW